MALKEKKLRFWPLEKENINITYGKKKKKGMRTQTRTAVNRIRLVCKAAIVSAKSEGSERVRIQSWLTTRFFQQLIVSL